MPDSSAYYATVKELAEALNERILAAARPSLERHAARLRASGEAARSPAELATEFLTLGVLWRRYGAPAARAPSWAVAICCELYRARDLDPRLKSVADRARGYVAGAFLQPLISAEHPSVLPSYEAFYRLMRFLNATGEFREELKRLEHWRKAFGAGEEEVTDVLDRADVCTREFEVLAQDRLSKFLPDIERYLAEEASRHRYLEDQFLCGKTALEYYLNMVGAEVMNWGFASEFEATAERVILVPGCMRPANGARCKASEELGHLRCQQCRRDCNVSTVTRVCDERGVRVYIVPHASSFTRFLKVWAARPDTGVVAVACLPHLVAGGMQMRELGIAATCVVLDHPGCQRHWDEQGVATRCDLGKLLTVLEPPLDVTARSAELATGSPCDCPSC